MCFNTLPDLGIFLSPRHKRLQQAQSRVLLFENHRGQRLVRERQHNSCTCRHIVKDAPS